MSRFSFRFEKILRLRRIQERQEQHKFAKTLAVHVSYQEDRDKAIRTKESIYSNISSSDTVSMSLGTSSMHANEIALARLSLDLEKSHERLKMAQHNLSQYAMRRKSLELLKDEDRAHFIRDYDRKEEVIANERAMAVYAYKNMERG